MRRRKPTLAKVMSIKATRRRLEEEVLMAANELSREALLVSTGAASAMATTFPRFAPPAACDLEGAGAMICEFMAMVVLIREDMLPELMRRMRAKAREWPIPTKTATVLPLKQPGSTQP